MILCRRRSRVVQLALRPGERSIAENCAPRRLWLRWPGDVVRGVLWAGGDSGMTGCLNCPLTRPVLAQI